ncbi:MAG: hypothetical protein OBKJMPBA_00006 [Methanophagales virus PBV304]|uniref:Uncharacterized protein n=1 Tax=Methanophagales virus PBV304 TaxID=3071309 RepID=A0AA46TDL5_9VIRU|nr:MAG: hypothetical protein QIT47_gp06 [Methanophagales virus PBV304]UYL65038.1 MAG: hypothetical protein OBKJMPBA_00006 [Methanophagales virus PBV304]
MTLKGNLLFNGDFETGTSEGWVNGAFGKAGECSFFVTSLYMLRGNYGGMLAAPTEFANSYMAYNKTFALEEYEAYLYLLPVRINAGLCCQAYLYGLDDKGNLIDEFPLGYNDETGYWRTFQAIIRGYADVTHFQVGLYFWGYNIGDTMLFDEVKLFPLKSVKSHMLVDGAEINNLTSDTTKYYLLSCLGRCQLKSILWVTDVEGTDPTLDVEITVILFKPYSLYYTIKHTTVTEKMSEDKTVELPEVSAIKVDYKVGGTNPSFDLYHALRIIPL